MILFIEKILVMQKNILIWNVSFHGLYFQNIFSLKICAYFLICHKIIMFLGLS
jgi:hypothetical protein